MKNVKSLIKRSTLALCATALLASCGGGDDAPSTSVGSLRLIGSFTVPTKTMFQGVEFGGISGIDRAPDGTFWAVSDDRGGERGTPRFYNLSIGMSDSAINAVTVNGMVYIKQPDGTNHPASTRTLDPEGLRVAPNGNIYISSEGNYNAAASALFQPFLREYKTDGTFVRSFEIPGQFNYVDNSTRGGRSNKLFEALTIAPSGAVFMANEDALIEDGPITTLTAGSVVRVAKFDPATGKQVAQYAYALPPIPVDKIASSTVAPDNGLPELLAVSDTEFLALERAFADGVGNTIRIVRTKIESNTTDVSGIAALKGATYTAMTREVLVDMPITFQGIKLDNIEGMSWGQRLPNGNRTLILVSDNNFSDTQTTLFIAFEVKP